MSKNTDSKKKSQLGQFFTPANTAVFMASLFIPTSNDYSILLDPGSGIGTLSSAFLERCMDGELGISKVKLTAFEVDSLLHEELNRNLSSYFDFLPFSYEILSQDFIEEATNRIQLGYGDRYTHAILNPPYKKINSNSQHRYSLRQVGIETVNLYSAFLGLTLSLMAPGGQVVAIIPRSFCNGPYYLPFRSFLLKYSAIKHIHLFESRTKAFKDDNVLQENIIILLEKSGKQNDVIISASTDDTFSDLITIAHPFSRIINPNDSNHVIHIPLSLEQDLIDHSLLICHSLDEIGIQVSTGPVVDFRVKDFLRSHPSLDTVPLLYPGHFEGLQTIWPRLEYRKPNFLINNTSTEKWLYPNGYYCVVRRFSSKEEKRRIVASVVQPIAFGSTKSLGFENHLNVFHENKRGLSEALAYGLAIYLNASATDEHFRLFSGHTQVNATDLKLMKYPDRDTLISLGNWALGIDNLTQSMIDEHMEKIFS